MNQKLMLFATMLLLALVADVHAQSPSGSLQAQQPTKGGNGAGQVSTVGTKPHGAAQPMPATQVNYGTVNPSDGNSAPMKVPSLFGGNVQSNAPAQNLATVSNAKTMDQATQQRLQMTEGEAAPVQLPTNIRLEGAGHQ